MKECFKLQPKSPVLLLLFMEEATKECTGVASRNLLYADGLILSAESKEEVEHNFLERKLVHETRGIKMNLGKRKLMVTGKNSEVIRPLRYQYGVFGRGSGPSSILCTSCQRWCHNRYSGLRVLREDPNYVCSAFLRQNAPEQDQVTDNIQIDGISIKGVKKFCC